MKTTQFRHLEHVSCRQIAAEHHPAIEASRLGELPPGDVLDHRFLMTEVISRSGTAMIFKAQDPYDDKANVALKMPHLKVARVAARKAHTMKKFMILAVLSVGISLQAGAVEPNAVSRYSSRAALLPPRVTTQTHPTASVAAGDLSGRFAFLVPRPGLVVVNAQPLDSDRYNTKAGLRGATRVPIEMAPLK